MISPCKDTSSRSLTSLKLYFISGLWQPPSPEQGTSARTLSKLAFGKFRFDSARQATAWSHFYAQAPETFPSVPIYGGGCRGDDFPFVFHQIRKLGSLPTRAAHKSITFSPFFGKASGRHTGRKVWMVILPSLKASVLDRARDFICERQDGFRNGNASRSKAESASVSVPRRRLILM